MIVFEDDESRHDAVYSEMKVRLRHLSHRANPPSRHGRNRHERKSNSGARHQLAEAETIG